MLFHWDNLFTHLLLWSRHKPWHEWYIRVGTADLEDPRFMLGSLLLAFCILYLVTFNHCLFWPLIFAVLNSALIYDLLHVLVSPDFLFEQKKGHIFLSIHCFTTVNVYPTVDYQFINNIFGISNFNFASFANFLHIIMTSSECYLKFWSIWEYNIQQTFLGINKIILCILTFTRVDRPFLYHKTYKHMRHCWLLALYHILPCYQLSCSTKILTHSGNSKGMSL